MGYDLLIGAAMDWRPDVECIAEGDRFIALAIGCYVAGFLWDGQIRRRIERIMAAKLADEPAVIGPMDAAISVARHFVIAGAPTELIVEWLTFLAARVPCWCPDDRDEIAALVRAVSLEFDT
jgi:hypothetical protein